MPASIHTYDVSGDRLERKVFLQTCIGHDSFLSFPTGNFYLCIYKPFHPRGEYTFFIHVHGAYNKTRQSNPGHKKTKLKPNKHNRKAVFKTGNGLQLEKERSQRIGNHTILYNSWMDQRMSQEKNFRIFVTEWRWKQNTLNVWNAADLWPEGHPQHRTQIQPKKERCKSTRWGPLECGEENEVTERREETVKTADVNGLWNREMGKEINETRSWWSRKVNEVSQAFFKTD